jgi:hypothetical protein
MDEFTGCAVRALPRRVPLTAVPLAVLDLTASTGITWRERLWLLRDSGRDSLWAAVADSPDRAMPVVAVDADGTLVDAAARLLAFYLAETRAEIAAGSPASALLPAERLAAVLALRRAGWLPQ